MLRLFKRFINNVPQPKSVFELIVGLLIAIIAILMVMYGESTR